MRMAAGMRQRRPVAGRAMGTAGEVAAAGTVVGGTIGIASGDRFRAVVVAIWDRAVAEVVAVVVVVGRDHGREIDPGRGRATDRARPAEDGPDRPVDQVDGAMGGKFWFMVRWLR